MLTVGNNLPQSKTTKALHAGTSVRDEHEGQPRHYKEEKVRENVEAEIFQVCLDETKEAFEDSCVKIVAMQSNTLEELNEFVEEVRKHLSTLCAA